MKMQLMRNTKYTLKTITNYNKNRCSVRMRGTYLSKSRIILEQSDKCRMFKKLFLGYTGLSEQEVNSLFYVHENIWKMSIYHVADSLRICKNFNVDMCSMQNNILFLNFNREELKTRLLVLKEMGAKYISTTMIQTMATYVPMILFKSYACIPDNLCVADIMFSTLRERPSRVSSLGTLDECMTVHIYRQKCLKHYLRWKFKTDDLERLDKLTMKLKCKPLTDIERCFDVLHNHGKMPSETIFEHQCLVNCSENELRIIFRKISTICGVPIVELLGNLPALHKMKYVNVACIKTHLEAHDVTGEQMKSFPEVLLLEREDFLKAWTLVVEKPELRLLLKHPNILRIFSSPKHFQIRLEYLEYLNVQNVTTNILASQTDNFERIMKVGAFRKLLPETCLTLCNDLEINHLHMQKLLRTHPRSRYLNLYNTYITLNYLQTKFSNSEIVQSLHTILYPKDKVEKVLEKLLHDNALTDASNRYTAAQLLALCVYEIEKEHHFTGDGVWDYEDKRKAPELSEKHSDGTGDRVK